MAYINTPGKFNNNTWLIDAIYIDLDGIKIRKGHAAYLIISEDNHNCLINPGTQSGAESIYRTLKQYKAWPPNKILISHSHWDHTQGVAYFRERIKQEGLSDIDVYASEKAIEYLNNQSYNYCFPIEEIHSEYINIEGVFPLTDGDLIDIGETIALEVIETPGHMIDNISFYDQENKSIFIGDTVGMSWFPKFYICNANSIYWKEKEYLESLERIRGFDLDYLCIAHFGVFTDDEINLYLDSCVEMYYKWMEIFKQNEDNLNELSFMVNEIWASAYKDFSERLILKKTIENAVKSSINYYKGKEKLFP